MTAEVMRKFANVRVPPPQQSEVDAFHARMFVITGLLEMRRAGVFRMVYCDDNRLAIVLPSENDVPGAIRQGISWIEASALVEEFRKPVRPANVERKPPARSAMYQKAKACQK